MSISTPVARPHLYHGASSSSSASFPISYNVFPANPNPQDAHLHATLQRIDELANEDVEMQAPLSESLTFLVLDTNILIHHFDVITQFVEDAEKQTLPVVVVIPGAVIYELDGQKNRDGLAWFARRASAWLLKKVKERKMVKGQANEETCKPSGNWKIRVPGEDFGTERMNDALILDCSIYFRRGRRTFLCSADKNLCIEAENVMAGIHTITPTRNWSSREIAYLLFGEYGIDLSHFAAYKISYKDPKSNTIAPPPAEDDENMMMVDDDASVAETPEPSHALDLLHFQVIDHFTRLLVELVGRVGGPEIRQRQQADDGTLASRHAPQRSKTHYTEWSVAEILEYLNEKKKIAATSPRVEAFLSKPYAKGARRGQDWSRRDWEVALEGPGRIGVAWEEASIAESLRVLDRHVEGIFATKMRPTGV